jgi:hypothetical protein
MAAAIRNRIEHAPSLGEATPEELAYTVALLLDPQHYADLQSLA